MHNNEKTRVFFAFVTFCSNILAILFWITTIFGFENKEIAVLTIASAALHEASHAIFSLISSGKVGRFSSFVSGPRLSQVGSIGYREEALIYGGGAIGNIFCAVGALPFLYIDIAYASAWITVNLATAAANLVPVRGNDGYGLVRVALDAAMAEGWAYRLLSWVSFGITVTVTLFALYALSRIGEGYWVFGVYFARMWEEVKGAHCGASEVSAKPK